MTDNINLNATFGPRYLGINKKPPVFELEVFY